MCVLISGADGLIGGALTKRLEAGGATVVRLTRRQGLPKDGYVWWDPERDAMDAQAIAGCRAVVHLAGESIAGGRWTDEKKRRIVDSRLKGTRLLCQTLAALDGKPETLICASAIGYYGNRDDTVLDETSPPGAGFLADLCQAWEAATAPAAEAGIRVVNLRIGMVLSKQGGALKQMLLPFRLGLGGPIGNGGAWMSWIALDDLVSIMVRCLEDGTLSGPINAVTPQPVVNGTFTRALGRALKRPALLPVPPCAINLILGEMGRALLLSSARVVPKRLEEAGFTYRFPEITGALHAVLKEED